MISTPSVRSAVKAAPILIGCAGADLGEAKLDWLAVVHANTDQPHAHVMLRGRRADGRDLVIPRAYVS